MGFASGVNAWRRFLKPGGVMAVSEITWTSADRPRELDQHWCAQYPEIDVASNKIATMEAAGFRVLGYFVLPESCWTHNYYAPMEDRFEDFLVRHQSSDASKAIVAAERAEIAMYQRYKSYYGYGMYIAQRIEDER
ncbi:MAG: hypothetical protein AAAFM81_10475 [Pseudomonadota bacterium]